MKIVDVNDNTYIDSIKEVNDKDPKFKDGHTPDGHTLRKFLWSKEFKIQYHG